MVLAAIVGAVACSEGRAVPPAPAPARIALPTGTLYLMAGERPNTADLYRVRSSTGLVEQLTRFAPGPGISTLTAGFGQVVVAAAPRLTDKIYRLVDSRLELLIDGRVFGPALSDDGRLAYTQLRFAGPGPNAAKTWAVVVRDLALGQERTVYESPLPTSLSSGGAWSPNGSILLTEKDPDYQARRILILAADGSSRQLGTGLPRPGGAMWSRLGWVAVADRNSATTAVVNPTSGEPSMLPRGWRAGAWSPDGSSLLVSRGRRLGLVSLGDTTQVTAIGDAGLPVHLAAWADR